MADALMRCAERDGEHDDALAFTLTKPVDLAGLDAELRDEEGWRKEAGLVAEGDVANASEDEPVTLWVQRGDETSTSTLKRVVNAHVRDDHRRSRVELREQVDALRAKAQRGEDFNDDEIQTILRRIVLAGRA